MANRRRKTKVIRVFESDINEIKMRFPDVRMADFFHMTTKTNPFIQAEATLRKLNVKKK